MLELPALGSCTGRCDVVCGWLAVRTGSPLVWREEPGGAGAVPRRRGRCLLTWCVWMMDETWFVDPWRMGRLLCDRHASPHKDSSARWRSSQPRVRRTAVICRSHTTHEACRAPSRAAPYSWTQHRNTTRHSDSHLHILYAVHMLYMNHDGRQDAGAATRESECQCCRASRSKQTHVSSSEIAQIARGLGVGAR